MKKLIISSAFTVLWLLSFLFLPGCSPASDKDSEPAAAGYTLEETTIACACEQATGHHLRAPATLDDISPRYFYYLSTDGAD